MSRAAGVSTAARAMVLPPGPPKGLRRYERLNLLGESSDAKVFAAWDCSEAKLVGVKVEQATDDEAARELLAFWMLPQHENVLRLLDCFRDSGHQVSEEEARRRARVVALWARLWRAYEEEAEFQWLTRRALPGRGPWRRRAPSP